MTTIAATINGHERRLTAGTTLRGLLDELSLEPVRVAVEVNRELVRRAELDQTVVGDGDRIEIVTFVGGG
jgi:thiamine biosynthesis protein ThiS